MFVRFVYLDDESYSLDGTPNNLYGSAIQSQGVVLYIDTVSFGGPYVIVDDGEVLYNLDLVEIVSVVK